MAADDVIDWEDVFENPDHGLIPTIERARTSDALNEICALLVEYLYRRQNDRQQRAMYLTHINEIFQHHSGRDDTLDPVIKLLRQIKSERVARAGRKREQMEEPQQEEGDDPHETEDAADIFTNLFLREYASRFDLLRDEIKVPEGATVPFLISETFADDFLAILRTEFVPELINRNRGIIARAESADPKIRTKLIFDQMADQKFRTTLNDDWHAVWTVTIQVRDLPEPPEEEEESRSLLSRLIGKLDDSSDPDDEERFQAWEAECHDVQKANSRAMMLWRQIAHDSEAYFPPQEEDKHRLGQLYRRSHKSIQRQITAISQMALQQTSPKSFEEYQRGKDVDLALLVACYRYPKVFLGKKGYLFDVMRGYPESLQIQDFPLVSRYLLSNGG